MLTRDQEGKYRHGLFLEMTYCEWQGLDPRERMPCPAKEQLMPGALVMYSAIVSTTPINNLREEMPILAHVFRGFCPL